jgi:hypothetical protein
MAERIDAGGRDVRIGGQVDLGAEERVRVALLMPADGIVVRVGVDMRVPHIVAVRVVEQVIDQRAAVVVVHRAVGELEDLEAGDDGVARCRVDGELVAGPDECRVHQGEVQDQRIDAAEPVECGSAGGRSEGIGA